MRLVATATGPTTIFIGLTAILIGLVALTAGPGDTGGESPEGSTDEPVATFSIVARDPDTGDLGVAVQSKFFAVGAVVPYAEAGVGAVATQASANTTYGARGLELLRQGLDATDAVERLVADDERRPQRQVGLVDARGNAASFTGEECLDWAGHRTGEGWAVQGNILAGPEVVDAMAEAFQVAEGDLASRLVTALAAGQAAGGDARGRQSAALLVVREGAGYGGFSDRFIDLRVDDHPAPIRELERLLDIEHGRSAQEEARRLLREAERIGDQEQDSEAEAGQERRDLLQRAVDAAERSTRLNPHDAWNWLTLAAVRLRVDDRDGAAAAGRRALSVNPWVKAAIVQGIVDYDELLDELLEVAAFRRVWETVPVR